MKAYILRHLPVVFIFLVYWGIGMWRLSEIPAAWFGDISIETDGVEEILRGSWPWHYYLSAGPLYHYFVAAFAAIWGISYQTYKFASLTMGAIGLLSVYWLGSVLFSKKAGLLAMGIMTLTFWHLVWTRLGNSPQIITPPLAAITFVFLAYFRKTQNLAYLIVGGLVSTLGLFAYPALYTLPAAWLLTALTMIGKPTQKIFWVRIFFAFWSVLPGVLWFMKMMRTTAEVYAVNAYVGPKIPSLKDGVLPLLETFGFYYLRALGMLHIRGDVTFRVNIPGKPHLDAVSGVLFLIGLIALFMVKKYRHSVHFLLIPLFVVIIPSVSPALPAGEIPNSGRTLAVVPFVMVIVSVGLLFSFDSLKKLSSSVVATVCTGILVCSIAVLNLNTYFTEYPKVLPDGNSPYDRIIAEYIDSLPSDTTVYLTSCCWGQYGHPEPDGIYYQLENRKGREVIRESGYVTDCSIVPEEGKTILIMDPFDMETRDTFTRCFPLSSGQLHTDISGKPVFYSFVVRQ